MNLRCRLAGGENTSLRYAVQLLTPAAIVAKTDGRTEVTVDDVGELTDMFIDAKQSAQMLVEHGEGYLQ